MGDVVGRLFHEFAITLAVAILISAVVSLTLTPDAVRAPAAPHARGKPRPPATRPRAASSTAPSPATAACWTGCWTTSALTCWCSLATVVLTVCAVRAWCPRASSRCRTPAPSQATTEADAVDLVRRHGRAPAALAERILRDPAVHSVSSFIGVDGTNTTLNTGRMLIDLQAPRRSATRAAVVLRRLADGTRDLPGIRLYAPAGAGPDHRRPRRRARSTSCCCPSPDMRRSCRPARQPLARAPARAAASWPTWPATCRTRAAGLCADRPRARPAASA